MAEGGVGPVANSGGATTHESQAKRDPSSPEGKKNPDCRFRIEPFPHHQNFISRRLDRLLSFTKWMDLDFL